MSATTPRSGLSSLSWRLTWFSLALLFTLQAYDALHLGLPAIAWVFKLLPLLVLVPWLLRDNLRGFIWLCFITLFYFAALVERLFAAPTGAAVAGVVAAVVLFSAAMLYVRWRAREQRAATVQEDS
jgi:uncharacterized membrane protein